jgi:glycerophosphoryl diester phosphodiesterase
MFPVKKVLLILLSTSILILFLYKWDAVKAYYDYFTYKNNDFTSCAFSGNLIGNNSLSSYREGFIAHGASKLSNYPADSKEALLIAVKNGFKFIEIDMQITSDGIIVAAHDWESFYESTGRIKKGDVVPLSLKEYMEYKIRDSFSPLTIYEINKVFVANPDLYLVTDKITDYKLIAESIPYQDRIIVEVFSVEQYKKAVSYGIKYPMLTITSGPIHRLKNSLLPDIAKNKLISIMPSAFKMADSMNLNMYAVDLLTLENSIPEAEKLIQKGVCIFAYTSNDKKYMFDHLNKSVTKFYTDYWSPNDGRVVHP